MAEKKENGNRMKLHQVNKKISIEKYSKFKNNKYKTQGWRSNKNDRYVEDGTRRIRSRSWPVRSRSRR